MIASLLLSTLLLIPPPITQATATPPPKPTKYINQPIFPEIASPTPIATATPLNLMGTAQVPSDQIYNYLATAQANVVQAPEDLRNPGVPVVPAEDGSEIFGYVKWITSANVGAEVFGPFGVIPSHIGALILLLVVLVSVYLLVYLIGFILRFVNWLISRILDIIPG